MKILILGGGLMGPAAAYNAMTDPAVTQVTICDISRAQLDLCAETLADKPGVGKLTFTQLDLHDQAAAARLMADFDAAVRALSRSITVLGLRAALQSGTPLVDLAQVCPEVLSRLEDEIETAGRFNVLCCGVEPGLTEIMARHLAEKMDRVDELHIMCGGIPEKPAPPLGYKIVFGGRQLPLRELDSEVVHEGQLQLVPRYSGVEAVTFPGVGECEAWHEGFKPWILDIPALKNIRVGTQKTVRWPGYAAKITVLKEMGLLSQEPVLVDGVPVVPKRFLDALLYPKVKLEEGEREITCFRVELWGEKDGLSCTYKAEMVDWFDDNSGLTSMARTTAFTGAIVARMIASGKLRAGDQPFVTPEQVITGPLYDHLIAELKEVNFQFEITLNKDQPRPT